jgi:hypothetical protein
MKVMGAISALFATVMLICAFEFLGKDLFYFGNMELKGRIYVWLIFIYVLTLTISGWLYAIRGKKLSGITHLILMSGVACLCLIWGFLTFDSESGPGNPVGPEVQLAGLAAIIIGIIAAISAVGVFWNLFKKFPRI